jgi:hypothetical protein
MFAHERRAPDAQRGDERDRHTDQRDGGSVRRVAAYDAGEHRSSAARAAVSAADRRWDVDLASSRIRRAVDPGPWVQRDARAVIRRVDAAGATTLLGAKLTIPQLKLAARAIDKGKLSKAGRAAHKHSVRPGSLFGPELKGKDESKNLIGEAHVDEILDAATSTVTHHQQGRYGMVVDVQIPGGKGVRFTETGEMIGFLEP